MLDQSKFNHPFIDYITFPIGNYQCNCSIFTNKVTKETIIVDPGNDEATILNFIKKNSLKVTHLIHTHAHFDHIGSSSQLKEKLNSTLYLHAKDLFLYQALPMQASFFNQKIPPPIELKDFLEDEQEFSLENGNNFLKTIYSPGHTPGSCSFLCNLFDVPLLLSGDTLFQNSIGRTDLPGGDSALILKSIKNRLFTLPEETLVVTGHGPATSIQREKRTNPFFRF